MSQDDFILTSQEAAARLGIKVETLYAYVSRGMLERRVAADGRTSLFSPADLDHLAGRRRRGPKPEGLEVVIDTTLTSIDGHHLRYRGLDAVELAGRRSFEWVAEWLWTAASGEQVDPWTPSRKSADLIAAEVAGLPPSATVGDRLRVAAAVAGATHSLRHDLRPEAVVRSARRLIATMVDALPVHQHQQVPALEVEDEPPRGDAIAVRLWPRLGSQPATPELITTLNAALILLADHELAASTLAARVAASTRADPYAVVGTGLGVLSGSLHGTASVPVHRLLNEVSEAGLDHTGAIVSEHLRHASAVPGFGHPLYPDGDPRAVALLDLVRRSGAAGDRLATVDAVHDVMAEDAPAEPNVDFGLAALAHVAGFRVGTGEAVFAVARAAGWIAHAIEEYAEAGNRFRARARYLGPRPQETPR
ncbi:MAG: citrate synthase family protein [Acidimicrobiales bacterium]